jgi:hypothetical protein
MAGLAFPLGRRVITPAALHAFESNHQQPNHFLARHQSCDWGDVTDEDAKANTDALNFAGRIFSVYHLRDKTKIYVITEADRSSTCVLLADEY